MICLSSGLAGLGGVVGIRVRQAVAGRHVHQDERIEGHPQPARLHLPDRLQNGNVRRRATEIDPTLFVLTDQLRRGPVHAIDRPRMRTGGLHGQVDFGLAMARVQDCAPEA